MLVRSLDLQVTCVLVCRTTDIRQPLSIFHQPVKRGRDVSPVRLDGFQLGGAHAESAVDGGVCGGVFGRVSLGQVGADVDAFVHPAVLGLAASLLLWRDVAGRWCRWRAWWRRRRLLAWIDRWRPVRHAGETSPLFSS